MPNFRVAPAALALLVACAAEASLPNPDVPGDASLGNPVGLSVSTAKPEFSVGEAIPATLHNRSEAVATVGALDCTADLERREADGWHRLGSLRACIALAVLIEAGKDFAFTVPAPDGAGDYRIIFEAYADGKQETVRSGHFVVR